MSAVLAPELGHEFEDACVGKKFFGKDNVRILEQYDQREKVCLGVASESCSTNLFFGFFFDGTRNNYIQAEAGKNHSNVARLYDCYPGRSVSGVLPTSADWKKEPRIYNHFFRVYVPGVSSPFSQVGDTGQGNDERFGAMAGALGERRIIWALLQAINNVHLYFLDTALISEEDANAMVREIILNKDARALMVGELPAPSGNAKDAANRRARLTFEAVLRRLHKGVSQHWPNERTGKPAKINPGIVKSIYISVFGFSRGATQARAFVNWLQSLCRLDAQLRGKTGEMTLGGFHVEFDFLGLFDTVASIGLANLTKMFHGHGAWADTEDSLRIPPDLKCLHLVAAHEIRRAFPVDAISVKGTIPEGCHEMVVPGVHSDVGCGYCPCEQGRGTDPNGDDMLARIPLLLMYKQARLSGVPLKLELAAPAAKARFKLKAETMKAFNAYISACKEKAGPLHLIMREQARMQIEWRIARRVTGNNPIQRSASFLRASTFDQNDLHSAAIEFEDEINNFVKWLEKKGAAFKPANQIPGFDDEHSREWEEIATWWGKTAPPSEAVLNFFDNYVHDSRAWFKLNGEDNEKDMHALLAKWVARRKHAVVQNQIRSKMHGRGNSQSGVLAKDGLDEDERRAADEYARSGKIPRMITSGREPHEWGIAGYLRFRKIYGGLDDALLASSQNLEDPEGRITSIA